jgi:hypothetical protein
MCGIFFMKKVRKNTDKLLSRDEFRNAVFTRDKSCCVICGNPGQDAHHILERRLFSDGGYYLSNGACLCGQHHIEAEQTTLSVEYIREKTGIDAPALPEHFYPDECYDKWGNTILENKRRTKGELFHDESVQKILLQGNVLNDFTDYVKYPRTLHLPWSPGATDDDKIHKNVSIFENEEVVVTEKKDGENTSLYTNYYHARSLDSNSHQSQSWARSHHAKIKYNIPEGWRICAENLYAKHSIEYNDLKSYLEVFSIWNNQNVCISWDQTVEWCELLELKPVDALYRGVWNENLIKQLYKPVINGRNSEGYVVRVTRAFPFSDFRKVVGKFVREGHVQTTHHWKAQRVEPNKLAI